MQRYDHEALATESITSAPIMIGILHDWLTPGSVLDVGCGLGVWLAEWERRDVEILGVDRDPIDAQRLAIPRESYLPADLAEPLDLGRRFDLVMSLEVAEHLEERSADEFVASLARHGDLVLFSAAIPGQGGVAHVNCQWPSYWQEKFAAHGFAARDIVRPRLWHDRRVAIWYRQNTVLYGRADALRRLDALPIPELPLDVVHPQWYSDVTAERSLRHYTLEYAARVRTSLARRARRALLTRRAGTGG